MIARDYKIVKAGGRRLSVLNPFSSMRRHSTKNILTSEINRAHRFNYEVGVLVVEITGSPKKGIHKLLPGVPLSLESFIPRLRNYDYAERSSFHRYTIFLPQTGIRGAEAVVDRMRELASNMGWVDVKMGAAFFPEDGDDAEVLLKQARLRLSESKEKSKTLAEPALTEEEFKKLI